MGRAGNALVVGLATVVFASGAWGQQGPPPAIVGPPPAPPEALVKAIEEGRVALAEGAATSALAAYRRAQGVLGEHRLYRDRTSFFYDESAAIYRGLAEAYMRLGDPYAAAVEASRGVNLADDDGRLWTLLGAARYRLADVLGAEESFERARALGVDDADVHWGRARVAIARNRLTEARTEAALAFERSPVPRFALARARWAALDNDYGAAVEALDDYLAVDDDAGRRVEAYRNLQAFYRSIGEAPVNRIGPAVTRIQLNFDLRPGDEIPVMPVRVNGWPRAYLLIDTGADQNVIDRSYAESIGIAPIFPGGRLRSTYREVLGGYAIVDSLGWPGVSINRVPFAVGDLRALSTAGLGEIPIIGVINPALIFREFLVVLDYLHRRVELIRYGAGGEHYVDAQTRLRKTKVPFWFDANGAWPIFLASIDGARSLPFLADTGASDLLIDRRTAAAMLLNPQRFVASVGGHTAEGLRGLLLDESVSDAWGMQLHGILGFPFIRGMRIAFDYRSMTMVVEN